MASFTENAIKRSFVRLLEKKPLKSITIRDIVDDCGINRSSFYYHFQDIPGLLERIIQEGSDSIIRKNANGTLTECMQGVILFLLRYKKSVLHVYKAVDREIFEDWVERACGYFVSNYLDHALSGMTVPEKTRKAVTEYYLYLVTGFLMKWAGSGLDEKEADEYLMLLGKISDTQELLQKLS